MVWLDGLIIIVLLAAIIRGLEMGLVRQLFSTFGFFGGLFFGVWLEGNILSKADANPWASFAIILACAVVMLAIAEILASKLKSRIQVTRIDRADRSLGSVVAAIAILIAVWLGASVFSSTPFPSLQQQIRDSFIIGRLNSAMPPAPEVIRTFGHLVTPNGFPQVFTGAEPTPRVEDAKIPDMGELTDAVNTSKASVVKIEGEGCGGIVDGSGFVAADGIVITNAHVVAGVSKPQVIDKNGTHRTTVIYFDPHLDLAILRTLDLAGKPLDLARHTADDGTQAAVLGYPGGGGFQADPAAILDSFTATGKNIYNQDTARREIYSMHADIISGNSGGPLINKDGTVIGVVFAHSVTYQHVGYSLTMPQVVAALDSAKQQTQPVSTGNCAQ